MVLAAVIVLPMVLDSEPEPLSDNIPIQIPGQNSSFQPSLSAQAPAEQQVAAPAPVEAPTAGSPPAAGAVPAPAPVDPRTPASLAQVTPVETAPPATPASKPDAKPETKTTPPASQAKPESPAKPPPVPAPAARTPAPNPAAAQKEAEAARALALLQGKPAPAPARSSASSDATPSRYAVQVVAVRSREGADALLSKLRGAGLSAYIETIKTPDGQVHRVRLGPFGSRNQAESAQTKLRSLPGGYNGSLVPL